MVSRTLLWVATAVAALGQAPAGSTPAGLTPPGLKDAPAFEVASVKPATPGETGGRVQFLPGGRFSAVNVALVFLLQQTYQLRDFQIVGDPRWMAVIADGYAARYNIGAKGDPQASEAQVHQMMQTLLADRFQLKVHKETRELPVYALIPAKGGIKMQPAKDTGRPKGSGGVASMLAGWIQGNNVAIPALVAALSQVLKDRPVVDKTGLADAFDFRLTWTPETAGDTPGDGSCPASFTAFQTQRGMKLETWSCPSIFTAVQDQLGLKLDPRKEPTEVLVVDHAERPSAN